MSSEELVFLTCHDNTALTTFHSQVQGSLATDVAVDGARPPAESRKRPRLDLSALGGRSDGTRERKRGKSMFGIVLGTLNKAKIEDKERNASEAVCHPILMHLTSADS